MVKIVFLIRSLLTNKMKKIKYKQAIGSWSGKDLKKIGGFVTILQTLLLLSLIKKKDWHYKLNM